MSNQTIPQEIKQAIDDCATFWFNCVTKVWTLEEFHRDGKTAEISSAMRELGFPVPENYGSYNLNPDYAAAEKLRDMITQYATDQYVLYSFRQYPNDERNRYFGLWSDYGPQDRLYDAAAYAGVEHKSFPYKTRFSIDFKTGETSFTYLDGRKNVETLVSE